LRRIVVLHRAVLLPAVFLLVSALLLSIQIVDPESSHAAGLPRLTGKGVTIYYDAGLQSTARSVKDAYSELNFQEDLNAPFGPDRGKQALHRTEFVR